MSQEPSSIWNSLQRESSALEVYLLGNVDFPSASHLQKNAVDSLLVRRDRFGSMLICEHPYSVSLGSHATPFDIRMTEIDLRARQIESFRAARAGGAILHAPGQLAVYLSIPIDRADMSLEAYVNLLGAATVKCCNEFRIGARFIDDEHAGIVGRCGQIGWVSIGTLEQTTESCSESAVAESGARDRITTFGINLNVNCDLLLQRQLDSCGGRAISSMGMHRMKWIPMAKIRESLVRNLSETLSYPEFFIHTRHPLLKRTQRRIVEYA